MLVAIVSVFNQAGPTLIGIGINRGLGPHKSMGVIVVVSVLYLVAWPSPPTAQRFMAEVTGRLAAWVMNDLRVKVFTHLQRLSLDFYTEEKAGVIMSRMTSDIENLQQLLQDGLAQFAVQGLTMIVITCILLALNVELALITILLVIPALTILSLWFRNRSERGYDRVRDGIADVLSDLSETLHGVRIVTAHNRQRNNVLHHRNVVGSYRDANLYTAQINAIYGPGTQFVGYLGQAALLGHRRRDGRPPRAFRRRPGGLLPLPQPLLRPDAAAGAAVQPVPARDRPRSSSCAACSPPRRACPRPTTPSSCRRFRATSSWTT